MSRIILDSQVIISLRENDPLHFLVKKAKNNYYNYFILPNIGLKLYSARVAWIDAFGKNLTLSFLKSEFSSLLYLLDNANKLVNDAFQSRTGTLSNTSLYYTKGDIFYIKCFIPPNVIIVQGTPNEKFNRPPVGCIFRSVVVDVRNIWESPEKQIGINIELKEVEYDF